MFICPLLKEVKNQEKDYRGYRYNDPSLKFPELIHQVKGGVINTQISPTVGPSTPMLSQTGHVYQQNVHFDDKLL